MSHNRKVGDPVVDLGMPRRQHLADASSPWIRAVSVMRHSRGGIMSRRLDGASQSATRAPCPASFASYAGCVRRHPSGMVG
jgi:hypothetical protein